MSNIESTTGARQADPLAEYNARAAALQCLSTSQNLAQNAEDEGDRLTLELGQAIAIIDLLFMVATDSDVESLNEDTLSDSLHTALMRLEAAKEAAAALISRVASGGGASAPKESPAA